MGLGRGAKEQRPLNPDIHIPRDIAMEDLEDIDDDGESGLLMEVHHKPECCWYRLSPQSTLVLFLLSVVGIVVGVGVTMGANSTTLLPPSKPGDAVPPPAPGPIEAPMPTNHGSTLISDPKTRPEDILQVLQSISSVIDLQNEDSPQNEAYKWIVDNDPLQLSATSAFLPQRYIMATLFFATGGASWTGLPGDAWIEISPSNDDFNKALAKEAEPKPECAWPGVDCDADNKVTHLYLSRVGLEGTLPYELVQLSHLEKVDFSSNNLKGAIPADFTKLTSLGVFIPVFVFYVVWCDANYIVSNFFRYQICSCWITIIWKAPYRLLYATLHLG